MRFQILIRLFFSLSMKQREHIIETMTFVRPLFSEKKSEFEGRSTEK